jgi:hypothetical protein
MAMKRRRAKTRAARPADLPVKRKKATKVKGADRARAADEVVVAFQPGSVRSPVVLGGLWDDSDKLPTSRT